MARIKRNAPCPCGSGRKQKHCCAKIQAGSDFTRARNLRSEIELGQRALVWAAQVYGEGAIEEAWSEFRLDWFDQPLHELDERTPFSALFFPWWLHGGSVDEAGSRSLVVQYLDSCRAAEDSLERRLAGAIAAAPFSFHRVVDVDPGRSMTLEDLFTGTVHEVQERSGSTEQARSTFIYARVAVIDGSAGLYGNGPLLVEPSSFVELKTFRGRLEEHVGRALTESDLHEFEVEIRAQYLSIAARILDPPPPRLVNTDGEPLAPTRLVYDLQCDCEHAFEKLKTLAKGHDPAELLDDAELDADGRLVGVSFPWIDRQKPGNRGMGPPILGEISIKPGLLEISVNSAERAQRIRRRITRRLGAGAKFRHAVFESIDEMLRDGAGEADPGPELDQDAPEIQEAIATVMKQRWAAWFDESIPALEGLTPRQAARTEDGRELLEALLAVYERSSRRMPESPTNPDIAALRRELGI